MELDQRICYRALRTRDRRFDGRFFTGVTSTGVYCRPICPARTPKRDNCRFFACAAAAEEAGFRPCLRCRPETSPGTPAWQGSSNQVSRALRLIDEGALDGGGIDELAGRLGVGSRHLRRLFLEHLGAPPLAVEMTRRVHLAKRLLEETELPVTAVALAAGFGTVRRFNAAFRGCFDRTPSSVRRGAGARATGSTVGRIRLRFAFRPPLDWHSLLEFLGPRAIPGVEQVDGEVYRRTLSLEGVSGVLELRFDADEEVLILDTPVDTAPHLAGVARRVRELCDLSADPRAISSQLRRDPLLGPRVKRRPGLRVPGAWDRFELAVRAVLGQQVTVKGATRLAGRLVERFGEPVGTVESGSSRQLEPGTEPAWLFPRPEVLARARIERIAAIGMPASRAATIRTLAKAVASGEPLLEPAAGLGETVARLTALEGVGDWTAHYVAMRALREPDAFPAGDLGLRRALAGAGGKPLTARTLESRAEAWRPWRAYAAMHLWANPN